MNKGCSGPCRQGRRECPTPLACGIPEDDRVYWQDLIAACVYAGVLAVLVFILKQVV